MKKNVFSRLSAAMLSGLLLLSLTGCGGGTSSGDKDANKTPPGTDTSLSDVQKKGVLVVGMNAEFAPYEFHAMIDGKDEIVGYDISIAKAIAADLGVELEIQEMTMDGLIVGLNSGQVDILISGLSATEERREQIDFSDAYYRSKTVALIRAEDAGKYSTLEDLADKQLGVQLSSLQQRVVERTFPNAKTTLIESMNTLLLSLKTEQVDAVVTADIVCQMAISNNPELTIAAGSDFDTDFLNSPGAAVGARKGSDALLGEVNKTIARLKESGELDRYLTDACELAAQNQGA